MAEQCEFVADGYERAQIAAEPAIRTQVVAEFSSQLAAAGVWQRFWLWREIEREVQFRLSQVGSPDALY
jgi:hypothetical protein